MKISECFVGIQGEGSTAGRVRLFIRTSGCTLKCSFCDTKYHIKGRDITKQDRKLMKENDAWCITGGEPLLYQKELVQLISEYKPEWIEVETNGTVLPNLDTAFLVDQFNISPKEKRFQPKQCNSVLNILDLRTKNRKKAEVTNAVWKKMIMKFVYSDRKSRRFIEKMVKKYQVPATKVWIMPEGVTRKEIEAKTKEVWNYCLKNSFNFSPRLQVTTFGKKKGI